MQVFDIQITNDLQEITMHGNPSFPIGVYKTLLSKNVYGYVPLHWHDEIQFVLVLRGCVSFSVNQSIYYVEENNGIFINSSCLHSARTYNAEDSEYICFDINPSFLAGSHGSIICQKYLEPFLKSRSNAAITLNTFIPWQKEILNDLSNLFEIYTRHEFGFELNMYSILLRVWHSVITNTPDYINEVHGNTFTEDQRIKNMLSFIHQNYKQKITLEDVAKAANVSRSECCRFFKQMTKLTPFEYIISYRINQSILLLRKSDLTISEIADEVGFGSVSYYIEKFRKHTNYTPKEFQNYCITLTKCID
ncbi:AraC-like DNA-binding protein [Anaerosolibacter carboniphilus]|uniref:AraC-like DNA-binding protein n=1 Tax=Anaerosolibacter carboniphilus TaxID=1417629 RepID=A0A841KLD9_9FIRM|nr:AraC family transcriptional regulator [Anaerosolibacter carboniphilus]MBB6214223.1 AraC-like DNA-binding protein [Anaerosolibacter carboniphilus]